MKKMPTIFKRAPNHGQVINDANPDCTWVFTEEIEGVRKYDGSCCLIHQGKLYKRREVKEGKPFPKDFIDIDRDTFTKKVVGWVPVEHSLPENKYHVEALGDGGFKGGTYELLGPKVQGNPEKCGSHVLLSHADAVKYTDVPLGFCDLKAFLEPLDIEGLVFRNKDGRMAKIKKKDFGLSR